jgi:ATP-dependent DNA helicase RecQ
LDRRFIIDILKPKITTEIMDKIQNSIEEKKIYKHNLLNYLVYLIDGNVDSNKLQQEIGRYLGVDKHQLGRIYSTIKGDLVRSKSEVIIANLLQQSRLNYKYEVKLEYEKDKCIEPDFTINLLNGKTIYWEHLGMLGLPDYDNRWIEKQQIYSDYFPHQLILTYESAKISDSATNIINNILQDNINKCLI